MGDVPLLPTQWKRIHICWLGIVTIWKFVVRHMGLSIAKRLSLQ